MTVKIFALSIGALMFISGQAQAQTTAPAPPPPIQPVSTVPIPVDPPKAEPVPEKVVKVCHYEDVSGSMIPRKVCHSG